MGVKDFLRRLTPAVKKIWLQLAAGLMWSAVGVMLVIFASRWLHHLVWWQLALVIFSGLALAAAIYFFGFSKLARKNIRRINAMAGERVCLFAFQGWTSYPLVAFMIFLGIYLRLYSPVPKPLLAVLYLAIGISLFSSSMWYYLQVKNPAN